MQLNKDGSNYIVRLLDSDSEQSSKSQPAPN